jgi:hypothetical protein
LSGRTSVRRPDDAERRLIDTLGRRLIGRVTARIAKRVRGGRAKSRSRPSPENPGRAKPKGGTSGWRAKHLSIARDSREGRDPETEACRAGPALRRREHCQEQR